MPAYGIFDTSKLLAKDPSINIYLYTSKFVAPIYFFNISIATSKFPSATYIPII